MTVELEHAVRVVISWHSQVLGLLLVVALLVVVSILVVAAAWVLTLGLTATQ